MHITTEKQEILTARVVVEFCIENALVARPIIEVFKEGSLPS